jgi:hypothetical protein
MIQEESWDDLVQYASHFLETQTADGSDPGLCIVNEECLADIQALIDFGRTAKKEVLTKEQAYGLAQDLGIHLSEHGGTGDGVIGALAGTGLRLTGNDGRFKGHHTIPLKFGCATVKALTKHKKIDRVENLAGETLPPETRIRLDKKVKTVLLDHQAVLLVYQDPISGIWKNCTKQHLKGY